MTNINLATSDLPQKQGLPYKKGIVSIVIILALLLGGYGWTSFEAGKIGREIKATNGNYLAEYQQLTSNNKEIVDFQNRITLARGLLAEKNTAGNSLPELEKNILPKAHLTAYSLEKNKLALTVIADNFDILARQIASFKKDNYFSAVSVGRSSLNEENKVVSEIILNVN